MTLRWRTRDGEGTGGREGRRWRGRNLKERREEARDEDTKAFILIERPNNKAHALEVIMRYNL